LRIQTTIHSAAQQPQRSGRTRAAGAEFKVICRRWLGTLVPHDLVLLTLLLGMRIAPQLRGLSREKLGLELKVSKGYLLTVKVGCFQLICEP